MRDDESARVDPARNDVMSLDDVLPSTRASEFPKDGPQPYRIVIGIDFDETSEHALREGFSMASARTDVELHAVHAVPNAARVAPRPDAIDDLSRALSDTPRRVAEYIGARRAAIKGADRRPIVVHVRVGPPAEAVHQLAVDLDADVIIVGTHGRRGLKRLALGSVASELVQIAHCPVLVARPRNYNGIEKSAKPEPVCEDCAAIRTETDGDTMWCEYHSRPHVRIHTYGSDSGSVFGEHDPAVVPPRG